MVRTEQFSAKGNGTCSQDGNSGGAAGTTLVVYKSYDASEEPSLAYAAAAEAALYPLMAGRGHTIQLLDSFEDRNGNLVFVFPYVEGDRQPNTPEEIQVIIPYPPRLRALHFGSCVLRSARRLFRRRWRWLLWSRACAVAALRPLPPCPRPSSPHAPSFLRRNLCLAFPEGEEAALRPDLVRRGRYPVPPNSCSAFRTHRPCSRAESPHTRKKTLNLRTLPLTH